MRALVAAAVVMFTGAAWAQEIGTEIEPVGPSKTTPDPVAPPPDDPYANTTPVEPVTPAPKVLPPPPPQRANNKKKEDANMGPGASAGAGSFGVRARFGGGALSVTDAGPSPMVGLTYFATDQFALTFDAGMGLQITTRGTNIGFVGGIGLVYALRSPAEMLRPIVVAQVFFGKTVSGQTDDFVLSGQVGGGAEYFFSQHFSVNAQMLVGVPVDFRSGNLAIFTFSPGVGATLYF